YLVRALIPYLLTRNFHMVRFVSEKRLVLRSSVVTAHVAGGAGFYTSPQIRPAKSLLATQAALLQIVCGVLLSTSPNPLGKRKTGKNPRSLASPTTRRHRSPPPLRLSSRER